MRFTSHHSPHLNEMKTKVLWSVIINLNYLLNRRYYIWRGWFILTRISIVTRVYLIYPHPWCLPANTEWVTGITPFLFFLLVRYSFWQLQVTLGSAQGPLFFGRMKSCDTVTKWWPENDIIILVTFYLISPRYSTVILNDEYHNFEEVIQQFKTLLGCSHQYASDLATGIDREGRTKIKEAPRAECMQLTNKFLNYKPTRNTDKKPLMVRIIFGRTTFYSKTAV